jgi:hypothetical protein
MKRKYQKTNNKETVSCAHCRNEFITYKCRKRKFCSTECRNKSQEKKVTLKCENCNNSFEVLPYSSSGNNKINYVRKYCSPKCSQESQRLSEEHKRNVRKEYGRKYNQRDYVKEACNKTRIARKEYINEYYRKRYKEDKDYNLKVHMRTFLSNHLKRENKQKETWFKEIGCTKEEFKAHIESQFDEGMSWDNWSVHGWHMDHIIPLSKGGINHYTNLQPLWAVDNLKKGNKITYTSFSKNS